MARGRTVWDDEAEDILKNCRLAEHFIQLWQQAIERRGEASREAKNAAMDLSSSLESLHWLDRRPRVMPDEWESLSSASPGLADALVELSRAAKAAGLIADARWRKGTNPDSWDWVDRLNLAVNALITFVEAERDLADCKRDCMEAIRRTGRRLHTQGVFQALKDADRHHGNSTIKGALSSLVKDGLLTNTRGPKATGYGLPEWPE
jgi:hypothetical protein